MNKTKKLNRQNNRLEKQIRKENDEVYTDMICYIRGADIPDYEVEQVRQDLIEMILSAQERGEGITSLFTGDYKQFCEEVIEAIPKRTKKQKILYALDVVFECLPILAAVTLFATKDFLEILKALFAKTAINWNISLSLGGVLILLASIGIAAAVVQLICKNSFSKKWSTGKLVAAAAAVGIAFTALWHLGKAVVFEVNFFAGLAVVALLFAIHKLLDAAGDAA